MKKKKLVAHILTLKCASSSLRVVIKDAQRVTLVNIHILNYAAHPYYLLRTNVPKRPASHPTPLIITPISTSSY